MSRLRIPSVIAVVGAIVALTVSILTFAGMMFVVDVTARILGGVAFGLMSVWFLFLYRGARSRNAQTTGPAGSRIR